eukprot:CAMPEP_0176167918 /NCGR_PEP_ID=MMETSP0120_2-20121206/85935_1 /TAXON_ID=160619 /ORGANISM="Kryptoperidinium foliaceum, Strain CCMP 1326" /LENGTH=34 /DNA_ID= /DNA_START= /DNA_END= /DNA_ORIENTATION=
MAQLQPPAFAQVHLPCPRAAVIQSLQEALQNAAG